MTSTSGQGLKLASLYNSALNNWESAHPKFGNIEENTRKEYIYLALKDIKEAFSIIYSAIDAEPTRSIICRAGSQIAFSAGDVEGAKRMAAAGLSGFPPADVQEDLMELFSRATQGIHIHKAHLTFPDDSLGVIIEGDSIGDGYIPIRLLNNRTRPIEAAVHRTAERKYGRPYRRQGPMISSMRRDFELFAGAFEKGSFSFSMRAGVSEDKLLKPQETVLEEFMECISLIQIGDSKRLREKIGSDAYYNNFISLAGEIAPDGEEIRYIAFTRGLSKIATLEITKSQIHEVFRPIYKNENGKIEVFRGNLREARAEEDFDVIRIGRRLARVPSGLEDVVRLYWRTQVEATVKTFGSTSVLIKINPL